MTTLPASISPWAFDTIRALVREHIGVALGPNKRALVVGRLARRVRELGLDSFDAYAERLRAGDRAELDELVAAVTTHVTEFFRQSEQFPRLAEAVREAARTRTARLWSAGCSTGEEAWSMAIVAMEAVESLGPGRRAAVRILATDVSTHSLESAVEGVYDARELAAVSPARRERWFERLEGNRWRVGEALRRPVTFARHNLVGEWPMQGPFDAVFCRNVLIYFDEAARRDVLERFHRKLAPGGLLFLGASEGIHDDARFAMVEPSVYRRVA